MAGYPYAAVEAALADLYRAKSEDQRRTLRARINHLQRLEVIDVAPGKGRALAYEQDHIWRWMFCFELAEFGVTPATAAALIAAHWKVLASIFRSAHRAVEGEKEDVFLYVRGPRLMSAAWNPESDRFANVSHIGKFTASSISLVLGWLQEEDQDRVAPRFCIVNLTARLRLLNKSLAASRELELVRDE